MAIVKRDYYDLLGVERDADNEAIRRAFYAAARDCYSEGTRSPEAEERFRELSEAYRVLSNPGSRLLYDRYGYRGREERSEEEAEKARARTPHGEDVHQEVELRWYEAEEGASRVLTFEAAQTCLDCEGRGTAVEPDPNCPVCGGTGRRPVRASRRRRAASEPCPVCSPEPCESCGGWGRIDAERRLRVRIPPGLETGELLRVAGEGNAAPHAGIPGDLLLDVTVQPEPREPRLVRIVALALFLAAIAVLILYLH